MPDPENGNFQVVVKRRRTRRHRRNRIIRRGLFLAVLALFTAGASTVAFRYLGLSSFGGWQRSDSDHAASQERAALLEQILSQVHPQREVYPYSVVPGGIEDARDLRRAAQYDPVVAAHYAGFDYDHARVVQVALARSVYVSYRIGNHVYWMQRRIALHKGETLITDGHITARGRCGNRVEEKPQQGGTPGEPAPEAFEHPVQGAGTATPAPPVPFVSALVSRPQVGGLDPLGPMFPFTPFGGGGLIALAPPPFPGGLCGPPTKKGAAIDGGATAPGKKKPGPCGSGQGPSVVPEPTTWVMLISGLLPLFWLARRRFERA